MTALTVCQGLRTRRHPLSPTRRLEHLSHLGVHLLPNPLREANTRQGEGMHLVSGPVEIQCQVAWLSSPFIYLYNNSVIVGASPGPGSIPLQFSVTLSSFLLLKSPGGRLKT